jgi:hypothetical protein
MRASFLLLPIYYFSFFTLLLVEDFFSDFSFVSFLFDLEADLLLLFDFLDDFFFDLSLKP